jgi:hypothetical protein
MKAEIELTDVELKAIFGGFDGDIPNEITATENERNTFSSRTSSGLVNALNNVELLNFGGSTVQSDQ